jgi:hypothetical protein
VVAGAQSGVVCKDFEVGVASEGCVRFEIFALGIYSGRGAIGAKFLRMSARLLSWRRSAGLSFPAGDCLFFGHSRRQQTGILAFEFLLGRYSKGISQLGSEIAAAASQGDFRRVAALEGGSRD